MIDKRSAYNRNLSQYKMREIYSCFHQILVLLLVTGAWSSPERQWNTFFPGDDGNNISALELSDRQVTPPTHRPCHDFCRFGVGANIRTFDDSRRLATPPRLNNQNPCFWRGVGVASGDFSHSVLTATVIACHAGCLQRSRCKTFTWVPVTRIIGNCFFSTQEAAQRGFQRNATYVSGPRKCSSQCFKSGVDYVVTDTSVFPPVFEVLSQAQTPITADSPEGCQMKCASGAIQCNLFSYSLMDSTCTLKRTNFDLDGNRVTDAITTAPGMISGSRSCGIMGCFQINVNYRGAASFTLRGIFSAAACQRECDTRRNQGGGCQHFSYNPGSQVCYLKPDVGGIIRRNGYISGPRCCCLPP